jgi:cell division protein FtsB
MAGSASVQATAEFRRKSLRTLFWFLAAVLLFNLFFGEMGVIQGFRLRSTAARVADEVRTLQAENDALREEIRALQEDPFRIESIARQELGLGRPGEIIFLFPGGDSPTAPPPASPPGSVPSR